MGYTPSVQYKSPAVWVYVLFEKVNDHVDYSIYKTMADGIWRLKYNNKGQDRF